MAAMSDNLGYNYYAIVLTEESRNTLLELCKDKNICSGVFECVQKVYCDHCTIMHNSNHNPYVKEYLDT